MGKKLAIKGHSTRGKEVIELLEMMGGINDEGYIGTNTWKDEYYFLDNGCIHAYDWCDGIKFTLEEFLAKYPFKVGDKVFLYDNITEGCVTGMKWNEDKGTVKYCVYTSSECWCDVKELLKWNNVDLNKRHYMDNMEEKDKAKAPDIKGEDYSGKRFGYKIPDGYEFDVVVDGKIFIKPIKPKYPTTYEDCCDKTNFKGRFKEMLLSDDEYSLYISFIKLKRCRDAYWKIAGEQMGLGKPWESPLPSLFETVYCIRRKNNEIIKGSYRGGKSEILEFPTEEMRDAFYENFKDLIEQCKELL